MKQSRRNRQLSDRKPKLPAKPPVSKYEAKKAAQRAAYNADDR